MTDHNQIFLVVCERGQYSDFTTWVAAAYFSKQEAEKQAKKLLKEVGCYQRDMETVRKNRPPWLDPRDWSPNDRIENERWQDTWKAVEAKYPVGSQADEVKITEHKIEDA